MKKLNEMTMVELEELKEAHRDTYLMSGCEDYKQHFLTVEKEIISRQTQAKKVEIKVYFQHGYRWSVDIEGQEESYVVGVNKAEAMQVAKDLAKKLNGVVNAQKLSKAERKENISYLAKNTSVYGLK